MDGSSPSAHGGVPLTNLFGLLVPLLAQSFAYGQFFSFVPTNYKTQNRPCTSVEDCDGPEADTVCWWLYDGCSTGQCMCDPRTHVTHASGRCLRVRRINEACDGLNDTCSDMLECINGTCLCPHVRQPYSSLLCIHPHWRPLGVRCSPSTDICYHESAYGLADREVECSRRGICQCKDGYKKDGRTCRRLHIWEMGCRRDYDCEGGAVCVDEQCACPTGYKSVAGNTKCAKVGATLELPLKSRCDEINERKYCSRGLVCHRCKTNENIHICAKYLPGVEADKYSLPSGGENLLFPSPIRRLSIMATLSACVVYIGVAVR